LIIISITLSVSVLIILLVLSCKTSKPEWGVSSYPNGHRFAFTIVHDADNSYSERLKPLFSVFDKLGFKLTVSVFVFWANWANNGKIWANWDSKNKFFSPYAVPLADEKELKFYKQLVNQGHEIGMHTPTDGADKREIVIKAFETFKDIFGHYPKVYVEHRCADNLECHQSSGADPGSNYYITDLLNHYGPWCWIISPSALPFSDRYTYYNLLSKKNRSPFNMYLLKQWGIFKKFVKTGKWKQKNGNEYLLANENGSPFDNYALAKYGLLKGFRRSGRAKDACGNGFLRWYSMRNIDLLEKNLGLAIVYTHLNTNWLDRNSKKMRRDIEKRLEYIASKNVWLATASDILERFSDMRGIHIAYDDDWLKIINAGSQTVTGLTVISYKDRDLCGHGKELKRNKEKMINIGTIKPNETLSFRIKNKGYNN